MSAQPVVIGIDVGTQGARAVAHDSTGRLVASESERFAGDWSGPEQHPSDWWTAVTAVLTRLTNQLGNREVAGISVTSTSGTVLPLDTDWQPVAQALMYGDRRSADVAADIDRQFPELGANVSWGLPKIVWFERAHPELAHQIHAWRHPADFLIGRLTGEWTLTDQTTALKSGFDPARWSWPDAALRSLEIDLAKLPAIGTSGRIAGRVSVAASNSTGLRPGVPVMLGMTDGCASQVGAGAVRPGAWNSTIGTTLVIKGTTMEPIVDPLGRIYNHRHPQGSWMPGAASNTGAAWISAWFPDRDLNELDRQAATVIPTGRLSYPLLGAGERFPFVSATATGFSDQNTDDLTRYASGLEGVAYLERMAFDLVEELSGEGVEAVNTAGGGSAGETWLRIRANVLDRPIRKVRNANAATGAAMIAASGNWYSDLITAVEAMVELESTIEPDTLTDLYRHGYDRFRSELTHRRYLP
ncbi:MAG: FGGY-family carbohydrate kinase [Thermomicrobiales bacterium]|nr:FGGY-family carbohydrate kinase [Thermomicrobiales bacterium]